MLSAQRRLTAETSQRPKKAAQVAGRADLTKCQQPTAMLDVLQETAAANPVGAAIFVLVALWFAANYFRASAAGVTVGQAPESKEAALRAARARQQEQLAAAAEKRVSQVPATPAAPAPPAAPAEPEMPERMRRALEKKRQAAAAAAPAPPPEPAPAPAPASASKNKLSYTERLEKIERGKGPSDHNPLHGHGSGSSAGPSRRPRNATPTPLRRHRKTADGAPSAWCCPAGRLCRQPQEEGRMMLSGCAMSSARQGP
jgi:hypothetical protein